MPARRTKQVARHVTHRPGLAQVSNDVDPRLKHDAQRVVGRQRFDPAVTRLEVVALGDVGAKQAIKNYQHAAVVGIEIFKIGRVVHPVRRRRVDDAFKKAKLRDPLGVNPELIEQIDRKSHQNDLWRKAQQRQWRKEHQRQRDLAEPAEAIGGREVELIGRMVHGMIGPEPAHAVTRAVKPVVGKLECKKQHDPAQRIFHVPVEHPMFVKPRRARQRQERRNKVCKTAPDGNRERRHRATPVILPACGQRQRQPFDHRTAHRQQRDHHVDLLQQHCVQMLPPDPCMSVRLNAVTPRSLTRPFNCNRP